MNRLPKRRALPLLLFFALLIVSLAILIPTAASADPEPAEIQDFSYQTLTNATVSAGPTDLRFLFTISEDKLEDYSEVGVIVSKTVDNPTYDAANCYTKKMTVAYRTITADSKTTAAPDGRYWVAAKLTGIPHNYYDGKLYIRAFVKVQSKSALSPLFAFW